MIAPWVASQIARRGLSCSTYLEPFLGSGAVLAAVSKVWTFPRVVVSDAHPDLVLMWQAIAAGWQPPTRFTLAEYNALRDAEPSALRGFAGFGSSYGGKWFTSFVDRAYDKQFGTMTPPFAATAARAVRKLRPVLARAALSCCDYRTHTPGPGTVVYCDPPYGGTMGYDGTLDFDSAEFWRVAAGWVRDGALVLVSEQEAPADWRPVALRPRRATFRVGAGKGSQPLRQEFLFAHRTRTK